MRFIVLLLSLALAFATPQEARAHVDCRTPGSQWTATEPPINLTHVFCGQVNRRGKVVGYHARQDGMDPLTARVLERRDGPDQHGVYTATVEIYDLRKDAWAGRKFSSMFPDDLDDAEIVTLIIRAYKESGVHMGKFRAPSGKGFTIEGWINRIDGKRVINTAYPIYRGN